MRRSARTRAAAGALAAAALLGTACGGGGTSDPVKKAGDSVGRVHSGSLHVRLDMAAGSPDPSAHVGFSADGSFAVSTTALPVADLTLHDLGTNRTTRFVSDGSHAFVVVGDTGYQLTDQQTASLRTSSGASTNGLSGLDLRSWVVDRAEQPTTTVDGQPLQRITGHVDPVAAIDGIVDLASSMGATNGNDLRISDADAPHVRSAMTSSNFELLVSPSDGLLRRVTATMEFAPSVTTGPTSSVSPALVRALAQAGHVSITIELAIDDPNGHVAVTAPARTAPIDQLPRP